jgi:protein-export chaperone SecB
MSAVPPQQPIFQIQRMYLKDLSLEIPGAPRIFLEQQQPAVEISLDSAQEQLSDGIHEVTVTVTVTTRIGDKVLFLVEARQGGIFEIRNIPPEQMPVVLNVPISVQFTPVALTKPISVQLMPVTEICSISVQLTPCCVNV